MQGALMRINVFLQHPLWEWSVYITCIEGKRAAEGEERSLGVKFVLSYEIRPATHPQALSNGTGLPWGGCGDVHGADLRSPL